DSALPSGRLTGRRPRHGRGCHAGRSRCQGLPHTETGMNTHTLRAVWAAFVAAVFVATFTAAPSAHAATAAQQQVTYAAEIGQLVDLHNAERVRHGRARVQFVTNPSVQVSQVYNDKLASRDRSLAHNTAAGMRWPGASPFGEN